MCIKFNKPVPSQFIFFFSASLISVSLVIVILFVQFENVYSIENQQQSNLAFGYIINPNQNCFTAKSKAGWHW